MKKLILLVQSEKDIADLPACIERLKPLGLEGVWCIHNPHLGVSDTTIEGRFAEQIARLDATITEAARREDFDAARKYKEDRDKLKIDRDLAVRDGWQKVPPDQRAEIHAKLFSGLNKSVAQNVLITTSKDVYPPEQAFELLQKMRAAWPAPLPMGSFVVGWPGSVGLETRIETTIDRQTTMVPEPTPRLVKPAKEPKVAKTREEQIRSMGYFGLKHLATKLGVIQHGMKNDALVAAILAKEAEEQQSAA